MYKHLIHYLQPEQNLLKDTGVAFSVLVPLSLHFPHLPPSLRGAFWGPRSSPLSPKGSEKGQHREKRRSGQRSLVHRPAAAGEAHPPLHRPAAPFTTPPASAQWCDRRDYVFIEFCVEDSKDVNVTFEKPKLTFSCLRGSDNFKHLNLSEIDLFHCIDPNDSKHKRADPFYVVYKKENLASHGRYEQKKGQSLIG
uniref:Prostaglandin E synthase 3 n=1 Tax=Molossus molossus TaxID=27622 RepID=A0A7J8DTK7_MOLMO|nr:hypothetical protein HJG59_009160 [Molossus molossus]